ncbi:MAG TPA: delta-60 repeat domain-containing protein [Panacibacter sp.]|nr:delta-60 repeat domain-containing protein [Panacibacter sp.]
MKNFICLISCLHYFCITINAQPGTLDKSFGDGGKAINEAFTGNCYTIALQPDGKIVTGGYYYNELLKKSASIIARFNNDGSVDNFFGESGKVLVYESDGARASGVISLAIQADGKIMVCNLFFNQRSEGDIGLIRLNTNGSIDSSFDEDGIVIKSIGKDDIAGEMMLQPDGKILVTGKKGVKESEISPVYVIRYLSNGKPDDNFGEKSLVVLPENMYIHEITAIDLQPDGKILCADLISQKHLL